MKRRKTYVIRNDDEGWTYVGFDDYGKDVDLLSSYARGIQPGGREVDIGMSQWVAGKKVEPLIIGTITLDEPKPVVWTEGGGTPIADLSFLKNLFKNPPPDDFDYSA
jgi:hypothetical protein